MTPLAELLVLLLSPAVPLLLAVATMIRPAASTLQRAAPWAALPGLATGLSMSPGIAATVPWVLQGSEFGLDHTGRTFLVFSAAIWLAAGMAARAWIADRPGRFWSYFLLVMSGSLGLIIARDMLGFYLFFTVMSFASYGLVAHRRNQRARHAGSVYVTFVLAADMMIYAAMVLIARETGGDLLFETARGVLSDAPDRDLVMTLLVVGFGVKVGLLGIHVTLPLMYGAAPTPAGVVLAGVLTGAGLLGWLRLLPLEAGAVPEWGRLLMAAGAAAAFYGALVGLTQREPRVVLAYSSISQMGIMTVGVGGAVGAPGGGGALLSAVSLYALHHGFAKAALFLGAGVAERVSPRHRPLVSVGLVVAALALTGAPLTTGMLAKETLKEALAAASLPWSQPVKLALPWMSFATTLVLARFLWVAWPDVARGGRPGAGPVVAWVGLLVLTVSAAWLWPMDMAPELWRAAVLWETSWPVLLGASVSAAAVLAVRRRARPFAAWRVVPPGDVLVVMTAVAAVLVRGWLAVARRGLPAAGRAARNWLRLLLRPPWSRAAAAAEAWLAAWPVALTLLLGGIVTFWLLLLW